VEEHGVPTQGSREDGFGIPKGSRKKSFGLASQKYVNVFALLAS
jgi:hypothetical protein